MSLVVLGCGAYDELDVVWRGYGPLRGEALLLFYVLQPFLTFCPCV